MFENSGSGCLFLHIDVCTLKNPRCEGWNVLRFRPGSVGRPPSLNVLSSTSFIHGDVWIRTQSAFSVASGRATNLAITHLYCISFSYKYCSAYQRKKALTKESQSSQLIWYEVWTSQMRKMIEWAPRKVRILEGKYWKRSTPFMMSSFFAPHCKYVPVQCQM